MADLAPCAPRSGDEPYTKASKRHGGVCAPRSGDEPTLQESAQTAVTCAPRSGDEPGGATRPATVTDVRPAQRG